MWKAVAIVTLSGVVGGLPLGSQANGGRTSAVESGRTLFATYCASCHGTTGRGDGVMAEALRVRPGDLTGFAAKNGGVFPAEKTRRIINGRERGVRTHGSPDMPVWGDAFRRREGLSEEAAQTRIDAIVQYLASIQVRSGD